MSTKFTYFLEGVEVHPFGDWTIDYQRNEGQIFFRKVFRGEITFQGADYDLIMSYDPCTVLDFEIFCNDTSIFTGQFKTRYSFRIDEDSCEMTGLPDTVDEYSCIMDKYEKEYRCGGGGIGAIWTGVTGHVLVRVTVGIDVDEVAPLLNVLDVLLNDTFFMNCNVDIVSSFFNEDNFPNGDGYAASYGTNNYVTGAANRLDHIYIVHNYYVGFGFGEAICPAGELDNMEITFKFFEEILRERFNAYWYIDQNGKFRIEHACFFLPGFAHSDYSPGLDLTTLMRSDRKVYAYRTNKYNYITDKLFDQEVWEWQHYWGTEDVTIHGADFQGVPIFYGTTAGEKSDCVPGELKEYKSITPYVSSDIQWVISEYAALATGFLECPGCFILDIDLAGTNTVHAENGLITGAPQANGHLSTANLMAHYFTWERIFLTGNMNSSGATPVTFDSEIPKRLQDEIEIAYCCLGDFDPMKYIKTELGEGRVQSATFNKNSITVKLLYV